MKPDHCSRDCTGDYKSLTNEARSLTNLLDDIQDKYSKIPAQKREQLLDAYEPCFEVLSELDKLLQHYNSLDTKSKRAWDRLKWDPEKSRSLRERLAASVTMLNAFYTSLIHDNQVLILEALERLELDYKGGCREESIASIERIAGVDSQEQEEDEDAAWTQIIRDLEDVGISQQIASAYHDFVVDWFIKAVNEGRLLEERKEPESLSSTRPSSDAFDVDFLSKSLAASALDTKSGVLHVEDRPIQAQPPAIIQLQRSDSSNAPEALHVADPPVETWKELHSPDPSYSAPEPVHIPSPSTEAPEPMHGKNAEFSLPVVPGSEAPVPVLSATFSDLNVNAQHIVAAWNERNYASACELLEEQLAAVEQGLVTSNGLQPDRRVLRHCIGVCASFSGNLTKAKHFFESAFNGIYLIKNLDDGDIAAARWLGDVCLQLHEFNNTVLAWSVALEGSTRRYGHADGRTRQIVQEMLALDGWVQAFRSINSHFLANVDPTDVFSNTHALEKSDLVRATQARVYEGQGRMYERQARMSHMRVGRPDIAVGARSHMKMIPGEAFFTSPLVSSDAWPLQWDATFCPMAVYQLRFYLKVARPSQPTLADRSLPTNSFGESKKLDFVTKAGGPWLVETVMAILRELKIEYNEHSYNNIIICRLDRKRDGRVCSEGVLIGFWKVQFRNVCGIKISGVKWSTRMPPSPYREDPLMDFSASADTLEFKDTIREMLEVAGSRSQFGALLEEKASVQSSSRSWKPWGSSK
ncbi:hypothetical protein OPT61_g8571 [Boeremia exigua]|uniref:Uncharacterized protein n=1 Tax=Boeremia exigua TaxID=749465 RepID=A0ACC2HXR2_9PLEO|nr:hypothetical protein OPT61_g8571 [Boeremia exigua]